MRFVCCSLCFQLPRFVWLGQLEVEEEEEEKEAALLAQSKACQSDGDGWHSSQARRSQAKPNRAPYRHELKRGSCSVGSRLCTGLTGCLLSS